MFSVDLAEKVVLVAPAGLTSTTDEQYPTSSLEPVTFRFHFHSSHST